MVFASGAIEFLYAMQSLTEPLGYINIALPCIICLVYVLCFILLMRSSKNFGEYDSFFSPYDRKSKFLYNWLIVERMAVGVSLPIIAMKYALFVPLACFILQGILIIVIKPYRRKYDNYRAVANVGISIAVVAIMGYFALAS